MRCTLKCTLGFIEFDETIKLCENVKITMWLDKYWIHKKVSCTQL